MCRVVLLLLLMYCLLQLTDPDHLVMTTRNREKYSCKYKASLGDTTDEDEGDGEVEVGRVALLVEHDCHNPGGCKMYSSQQQLLPTCRIQTLSTCLSL